MYCKNHPKRETNVSCSACGQGLCPDCMVYTPVGIKCRECASPTRGMLKVGTFPQYMGAALAGLVSSFIAGFVLDAMPIRSILIIIIFGLLIGEAIRRGARGNRGRVFMTIAGVSSLVGFLVSGLLLSGLNINPTGILYTILIAGIATYRLNG